MEEVEELGVAESPPSVSSKVETVEVESKLSSSLSFTWERFLMGIMVILPFPPEEPKVLETTGGRCEASVVTPSGVAAPRRET